MDPKANKDAGNAFEDLFIKQARRNGLLVIKNWLTAKFGYKGRLIVIPGELDFKIVNQKGIVGYFDCKSFHVEHFVYSQLDAGQVERARLYNDYRVPAGFIVWFRSIDRVVFYSGHKIARFGSGTRFEPEDGLALGSYENFDLKPLLRSPGKRGHPILGML